MHVKLIHDGEVDIPLCCQNLPKVTGRMKRPVAEIELGLLKLLQREEDNLTMNPVVFATLKDAVRMAREYAAIIEQRGR